MGSSTSIFHCKAGNSSGQKSKAGVDSTSSLSPLTTKYISDFQQALDNLPKVINPELRKCMFLFAIYPTFRNDFIRFFSSGKWVNEFLDSNSNLMTLMLISSLSFPSSSVEIADSTHSTATMAVTPTALPSSSPTPTLTKSKSMQIEIRGDTIRGKFRSPQHQPGIGGEFSPLDWLGSCCDDQSRELLAVFLTIAYPIYLSSYEFQSWLEYSVYDGEDDKIMKHKIEKEVNSLRAETDDVEVCEERSNLYHSHNNDEDDNKFSDHQPAQFEVTLHRRADSKIKLLHQRYSSSSDLLSRSASPQQQERFHSARKRLKNLIQAVISYFSFTHHDIRLENMLATTSWSQQLLSFLHSIRLPIVIGCIRNRGKKSTFGEMIMQGIHNIWQRSDFTVIYVNKAYEDLTQVTCAEVETTSMSDLLFGKVPYILEQHSVHSNRSPTHHNNAKTPITSPSSSSNTPRKTLLGHNGTHNVEVATASSTIQMTVESTRKNTHENASSKFINVTIMKPVHHVAADPDYHYVIATQYDLSPFLPSSSSIDSPLAQTNDVAGIPSLNRSKSQFMRQTSLSASQWQRTNNNNNASASVSANTSTVVAVSANNTLSCAGNVSDRTAASEMSTDSGTVIPTASTIDVLTTSSECCLEASSSHSSSTVPANKFGMKVTINTNTNSPRKDFKAVLSPAVYTQFNKDLPWIEDCLNLVPQFLY